MHSVLSAALAALVAVSTSALANHPGDSRNEPRGEHGEPPTRAGRLVTPQAGVWVYDTEQGHWIEGGRNRALTEGDLVQVDRGARAEIRIGSTELRLGGSSELELSRLDDDRMQLLLHRGTMALRLRSSEVARETEVRTGEGRWWPERAGHFRFDRENEATTATVWAGALQADPRGDDSGQKFTVAQGQRVEIYLQLPDRAPVISWSVPASDRFADWAVAEAQAADRSASHRYASPEMTGVDELDRHGRWERHPEYGMVWTPMAVSVGWAPYRHGRWFWHVRWGWTWQDDAPWGFAPFHYGRWVHWGGRWCWWPGQMVARPVFSPALVAWVGGSHGGFSISIGGAPAVGWVPLAPYDVYVPGFAYGPRYYERVNKPYRPRHRDHVPQVPTGPIMYGNKGVPNAVTVVPANVLQQRQPVQQSMVQDPALVQRVVGQQGLRHDGPVTVVRPTPAVGAAPASPTVSTSPKGMEVRPAPGGATVVSTLPAAPAQAAPGISPALQRPAQAAPVQTPQPVPGAPKLGPRPPDDEHNDDKKQAKQDAKRGAESKPERRGDRQDGKARTPESRHDPRDKQNLR